MVVTEVDDRVAAGGPRAQRARVVQVAALHLRPECADRRRSGVGPGQAGDVVAGGEQVADSGGADPPGRTGDEEAELAAETGIAVFRVAFERWVGDRADRALPEVLQESFAQLRALAARGT